MYIYIYINVKTRTQYQHQTTCGRFIPVKSIRLSPNYPIVIDCRSPIVSWRWQEIKAMKPSEQFRTADDCQKTTPFASLCAAVLALLVFSLNIFLLLPPHQKFIWEAHYGTSSLRSPNFPTFHIILFQDTQSFAPIPQSSKGSTPHMPEHIALRWSH